MPACTASLNVKVRLVPSVTPLALPAGDFALSVGATVSPLTVLSTDLSVSLNCTYSTAFKVCTSLLTVLVIKVSSLVGSIVIV